MMDDFITWHKVGGNRDSRAGIQRVV